MTSSSLFQNSLRHGQPATMVVVKHIVGPAPFPMPQGTDHLSVLSYNILLPNSVDGWWNYKMFLPPLTVQNQEIASWEYRRNLLRQRIAAIDADVVCLQEVSPLSFEDDFAFMQDLGYDENEMFKKGRFRPASFWKSSRCQLVSEPVHKDRTLLTAFRLVELNGASNGESASTAPSVLQLSPTKQPLPAPWYVLNCHLQAGKQGSRRLRQINEGIKGVMTLSRKLKDNNPASMIRLIVCGDFNGGAECAAVRFLEDGFVDETFREDGESVSSGRKSLQLDSPLRDAVVSIPRHPPSTLVVPELMSTMIKGGSFDNLELSELVVQSLTKIYHRLASHQSMDGVETNVMIVQDVERFLVAINGQVGRGSEFREAARQMGWTPAIREDVVESKEDEEEDGDQRITLPSDGALSLDGFISIYAGELRQGKFWGIAHDLAVLGEPLPDVGVFQSRFDRMYHSSALQPTAVMDFTCAEACPNKHEPSDHLPVAVSFCLKSQG